MTIYHSEPLLEQGLAMVLLSIVQAVSTIRTCSHISATSAYLTILLFIATSDVAGWLETRGFAYYLDGLTFWKVEFIQCTLQLHWTYLTRRGAGHL